MGETSRVPQAGEYLSLEDFTMIMDAVKERQEKTKAKGQEEPAIVTLGAVLFKIGYRFRPLVCVEGEWAGLQQDLKDQEGPPKCPYGHDLQIQAPGLKLGWLLDETD